MHQLSTGYLKLKIQSVSLGSNVKSIGKWSDTTFVYGHATMNTPGLICLRSQEGSDLVSSWMAGTSFVYLFFMVTCNVLLCHYSVYVCIHLLILLQYFKLVRERIYLLGLFN